MTKITVYNEILSTCISEIQSAKRNIAIKINQGTISVYWNIGQLLSEKVQASSYGNNIILKLSVDLKKEFPEMGLSPRNLWDMKKFYVRYKTSSEKLQRSVAVLPWSHNLLIMSKTSSDEEALFYASKAVEMAWTRDILLNHIKAKTHLQENTIQKRIGTERKQLISDEYKSQYFLANPKANISTTFKTPKNKNCVILHKLKHTPQ